MEPGVLAAHMEALVGPCCRLTAAAALLMGRVRRLFFMSEHQDLSRFLVTNLGITKYPQYRLQFVFMLQCTKCAAYDVMFLLPRQSRRTSAMAQMRVILLCRLNRPSSGFQKRQDMLEYEEALQHAAVLDAAFEVCIAHGAAGVACSTACWLLATSTDQ